MFFTFLLAWLLAAAIIYLWCYIVEVVLDLPISGQTPCTAHASLKNIIRRVLRDASNMAILKGPEKESELTETTTNRTYEDLLATAILNKVIDNYQTDLRRSSSGSTTSKKSNSSKKHKHSKKQNEERWRNHLDNPDLDTTSMSSIEEWCRSESSCGSKYIDHMSFTIQQSIEEISTSDDETPNKNYLHSCNLSRNSLRSNEDKPSSHEDWQDNWLFSRKGKSSPKPVPVPMLVPNPSTDFRALIGDRDADDTSDLSETGSDLDDTDTVHDIKTILVDSRTIIGGKNLLGNVGLDGEKREDNDSGNNDSHESENEEIIIETTQEIHGISEAKNCTLIHQTQYTENDSLGSNTEKDMEYTEKYASFPRQISKKKSPVPSPRVSKIGINEHQQQELIELNNGISHENNEDETIDDVEPPIVIQGSYSEKEREKWRNPVTLENNPYSKENLDKRLHNKSLTNEEKLYGKDYYIREAKRASGGRKKFLDEHLENSGHDFQRQQSLPLTSQNNSNSYHRSISVDQTDQSIYTARPIMLDNPEADDSETETVKNSRPVSLVLSTDSEDNPDVKRVFNIETGNVYIYKPKNMTKDIIEAAKSPEGTKSPLSDNKFDENHNIDTGKQPVMNISKMNHILMSSIDDSKIVPIKPSQQERNDSDTIEFETEDMNPEMREISKKYLQSLVKNPPTIKTQTNENFNNYITTPPISLQEHSIPEEELMKNHKSCIDLRNLPTNGFDHKEKIRKEFSRSLSKLSENEDDAKMKWSIDQEEIDCLPSVNQLKKLFDQGKPPKVGIQRTKSHLTTKPEFREHQQQIHSLTARSIPRDFRQKLQNNDTENAEINGTVDETIEDEDELKHIPPCKAKITYFEQLGNK